MHCLPAARLPAGLHPASSIARRAGLLSSPLTALPLPPSSLHPLRSILMLPAARGHSANTDPWVGREPLPLSAPQGRPMRPPVAFKQAGALGRWQENVELAKHLLSPPQTPLLPRASPGLALANKPPEPVNTPCALGGRAPMGWCPSGDPWPWSPGHLPAPVRCAWGGQSKLMSLAQPSVQVPVWQRGPPRHSPCLCPADRIGSGPVERRVQSPTRLWAQASRPASGSSLAL